MAMKHTKSAKDLLAENEDLRLRLEEAMDTLRAIRSDEVDALVVSTPQGDQVYTLKGAERNYRLILETLNEGVLTVTEDGTIMYSNSRFGKIIKMPLQKVIGSSIYGFISPTDRTAFETILEQSRSGKNKGEVSLAAGDETLVPVQLFLNPLEIEEVSAVCIVALDLTEQKRTEKQLQKTNEQLMKEIEEREGATEALRESGRQLQDLSHKLLMSQEAERRRISAELHDELGGALAVLKLRLSSIIKNLGEDPLRLREECEDNLQYVDEMVENVHRLSVDLSPHVLHDYGLSAGLRWIAENVAKNYDISVTCDTIEIDHLFSQEAQIGIYRIVQEALANVGKHAQAKNASIVTKEEGGWISFVIGDDGRGFELTAAVRGNGTDKRLGLATMNERVRMLGGFFDVWSHAGEGTRITFSIPTKGRGIV